MLFKCKRIKECTQKKMYINWIRNSDYHLILLQETHNTPDIECLWRNEWGFKIEFSHGSSASAGVCVLFKPSASFELLSVDRDNNGRILLIVLKVNDIPLTVVNIYGPNNDDNTLFTNLHSLLIDKGEEPLIIGGDFNTVIIELNLFVHTYKT